MGFAGLRTRFAAEEDDGNTVREPAKEDIGETRVREQIRPTSSGDGNSRMDSAR